MKCVLAFQNDFQYCKEVRMESNLTWFCSVIACSKNFKRTRERESQLTLQDDWPDRYTYYRDQIKLLAGNGYRQLYKTSLWEVIQMVIKFTLFQQLIISSCLLEHWVVCVSKYVYIGILQTENHTHMAIKDSYSKPWEK